MTFPRLILSVTILLLSNACQSSVTDPAHRAMPPTSFMIMWDEYQHCLTHQDLIGVMVDVDRLSRWAGQSPPSPPPLLRPVQPWVKPLPVRTAADPQAMLADCTLRAATLAKEQRLFAVAEDLYKRVSEQLPQDRYAYYVGEAKAGLEDLRQAQISQP